MSRARFGVTYDIVTPESAEAGDVSEAGWILQGATLRDAVQELHKTRTAHVDGVESIEADQWPMRAPLAVTVTNGAEFETGARESRAIHFPRTLTPSTARRIARLCGVRHA